MTETETHAHPKPNYIKIFVFLAVLTAVEVVAALFLQNSATQAIRVIFLLLMAVAKAGLVAAYYMHLRFEKTALRVIAIGPLVLVALLMTLLYLERTLPR